MNNISILNGGSLSDGETFESVGERLAESERRRTESEYERKHVPNAADAQADVDRPRAEVARLESELVLAAVIPPALIEDERARAAVLERARERLAAAQAQRAAILARIAHTACDGDAVELSQVNAAKEIAEICLEPIEKAHRAAVAALDEARRSAAAKCSRIGDELALARYDLARAMVVQALVPLVEQLEVIRPLVEQYEKSIAPAASVVGPSGFDYRRDHRRLQEQCMRSLYAACPGVFSDQVPKILGGYIPKPAPVVPDTDFVPSPRAVAAAEGLAEALQRRTEPPRSTIRDRFMAGARALLDGDAAAANARRAAELVEQERADNAEIRQAAEKAAARANEEALEALGLFNRRREAQKQIDRAHARGVFDDADED
jgi:hypothetical protein